MTDGTLNADPVAWEAALLTFRNTREKYDIHDSDPAEMKTASDQLCDAKHNLLALPAPDISAVIEKLTILWKDEMWAEDSESNHKLGVIGDLHRLEIEAAC